MCLVCACSINILITAYTKASKRVEEYRGLINATAYYSHDSWPYLCWTLLPTPVLLWPLGISCQWRLLAFHPRSIPIKDNAGEDQVLPPSTSTFSSNELQCQSQVLLPSNSTLSAKELDIYTHMIHSALMVIIQDEVSIFYASIIFGFHYQHIN